MNDERWARGKSGFGWGGRFFWRRLDWTIGKTGTLRPPKRGAGNGASHDALGRIVVDGDGFNLHWPALEADLYVPALVGGVFGTRAWMARALARMAGRPRKVTVG
jgi:hypothetical protein